MRTVKLSNGTSIDVRGLLRREKREMKAAGMNLDNLPLAKADEALDRVLELTVADDVRAMLEDLPNSDSMAIWNAVMKETHGVKDEEKN